MAARSPFDFSHLSIAERLQLVEDLWDSIAQEADGTTLPLTEEEKQLLDARLVDYNRDPDGGSSWQEVKGRILKRGS